MHVANAFLDGDSTHGACTSLPMLRKVAASYITLNPILREMASQVQLDVASVSSRGTAASREEPYIRVSITTPQEPPDWPHPKLPPAAAPAPHPPSKVRSLAK